MSAQENGALETALANNRIPGPPAAMFYIPDFNTKEEEASILNHVGLSHALMSYRQVLMSSRSLRINGLPSRIGAFRHSLPALRHQTRSSPTPDCRSG